MPADPVFEDGDLEYGAPTLTVTPKSGAAAFTVISDAEFNHDSDTKVVEQTNAFGEPSKSFGIPMLENGSTTVQLPAGKTIARGDTFVTDGGDGFTWIVTKVDRPQAKEDYRKQAISYRRKVNV